jgi:hypothetical protein
MQKRIAASYGMVVCLSFHGSPAISFSLKYCTSFQTHIGDTSQVNPGKHA